MKTRDVVLQIAVSLGVLAGVGALVAEYYAHRRAEEQRQRDQVWWCPMHPHYKVRKYGHCPYCNMPLERYEPKQGEGGGGEERPVLDLTPRQIQQTGVRTEPIRRRDLVREIDTVGIVEVDHKFHAHVTVRFSGWVVHTFVTAPGEEVRPGDPLATLYAPDVVVAQQELLLARQRFDEVRERPAHDPERQRAQRNLESIRERFSLWGIPHVAREAEETGRVRDEIELRSDVEGVVVDVKVRAGEAIPPEGHLFEIVPMGHLWVYADVYPYDLPFVLLGMRARVRTEAVPDRVFEGAVVLIEPTARPETQSVRVRVDVENVREEARCWLLKPGMWVRVLLEHRLEDVVAVPESAVISTGRRDVVLLAEGGGRFRAREVRLGRKWLVAPDEAPADRGLEFFTGHRRFHEVLAGLEPGAEVVTHGAFLLHAESQIRDVLEKMLGEEEAASEKPPLPPEYGAVLEEYFRIHAALARNEHPGASRMPEMDGFRTPLPEDLDGARRVFGEYTKALEELFERYAPPAGVYRFTCGMAHRLVGSPTETWFQRDDVLRNPYGMPGCGTALGRAR